MITYLGFKSPSIKPLYKGLGRGSANLKKPDFREQPVVGCYGLDMNNVVQQIFTSFHYKYKATAAAPAL